MEKLTSRKLALNLAGLLALVGIGVLKSQYGLEDAQPFILGIVGIAGGGSLVQAWLDSRGG